jgi:ABC-type uncharacterized transport system permease subunit
LNLELTCFVCDVQPWLSKSLNGCDRFRNAVMVAIVAMAMATVSVVALWTSDAVSDSVGHLSGFLAVLKNRAHKLPSRSQ